MMSEMLAPFAAQLAFSADDLALNRAGQVSPTQLERLERLAQTPTPPPADTPLKVMALESTYSPGSDATLLATQGREGVRYFTKNNAYWYVHLLEPCAPFPAGEVVIYFVDYGGLEYLLSVEPALHARYLTPEGTLRDDAFDGLCFLLAYREGDADGYVGRIGDYLTQLYGPTAVFWNYSAFDPALRSAVLRRAAEKAIVVLVVAGSEWESEASVLAYLEPDDPLRAVFGAEGNAGFFGVLVNDIPLPSSMQGDGKPQALFTLSDYSFTYDLERMIAEIETYQEIAPVALMRISRQFQYDDADMEHNQRGRLTWSQVHWLFRRQYHWFVWAILYLLPVLTFALMAVLLAQAFPAFALLSAIGSAVMVAFGFVAGFWQTVVLRRARTVEGMIDTTQGFYPNRLSILDGGGAVTTLFFPFETVLSKEEWAAYALRRYRVHYCYSDGENYLLSIYPIGFSTEDSPRLATDALPTTPAPCLIFWHEQDIALPDAQALITALNSGVLNGRLACAVLGSEAAPSDAQVDAAQIAVLLIGDCWQADPTFDGERDPLRQTLERLQARGVTILPVLLEGASMLGGSTASAAYRQLGRQNALSYYAHRAAFDRRRLLNAILNHPALRVHVQADAQRDFVFSSADLAENRAGRVTDAQRRFLRRRFFQLYLRTNLWVIVLMALLIAFMLRLNLPWPLLILPALYGAVLSFYTLTMGLEIRAPLKVAKARTLPLQFGMPNAQRQETRLWRTIAPWLRNPYDHTGIAVSGMPCLVYTTVLDEPTLERWRGVEMTVYYVEPFEAFFLSMEMPNSDAQTQQS